MVALKTIVQKEFDVTQEYRDSLDEFLSSSFNSSEVKKYLTVLCDIDLGKC
jgi:hypothetical protein